MKRRMIGKLPMCRDGFTRTAINRRANLQSPLKRTGVGKSPLGGLVRVAQGFIPVRACGGR